MAEKYKEKKEKRSESSEQLVYIVGKLTANMGFDENVKEQRNKSLLQDVDRYLKVLQRDGYVNISIVGTQNYSENELLRIVSLVTKDGKYIASRRHGLNS
ncbi:MAG TPA: hypothetical protein DHW64_02340 [Chitinophagaceae bacterium]|nr:hypothetical protein [Chitinophagaceae bacterium]